MKVSGERVSNTWVTCPEERDNHWKRWLIPHVIVRFRDFAIKAPALRERLMAYQLVGGVTAYQGYDG